MDELLRDIEKFCKNKQMSLSEFGQQAMADRGFVFGLRRGRQCLPATVDRVRSFLAAKCASGGAAETQGDQPQQQDPAA